MQTSRSTWYTRGWTLQELIAPEEAILYDKHWNSLGRKKDHVEALHLITGITQSVLDGGGDLIFSFCVARRMS
jgi:hypothetical protein